MRIGWPDPARV
ncbi:unnamed protein product, partial [Didymodactylos carnosus]